MNNNSISPKNKFQVLTITDPKSTVPGSTDDPPILQSLQNVPNLDNVNTSPIEVAKFIRGLKKSRMSRCGISGKFLHVISQPISYSFSKLLNNLFDIGYFPEIWKIAHVTLVYKRSGLKSDKKNYRPI